MSKCDCRKNEYVSKTNTRSKKNRTPRYLLNSECESWWINSLLNPVFFVSNTAMPFKRCFDKIFNLRFVKTMYVVTKARL